VARDRDRRDRVALALGALRLAHGREGADLLAQQRHAVADAAAVELDLRLTGAAGPHAGAARADLTARLAAHRVAPAAQARQQVLELRELDLRLALAGLRVLREDVEDHGRAVDDLDLDDVLERAPLAGRELGVCDDGVGALRDDDLAELFRLAAPDVRRGAGVRAALQHAVEHDGTRRLGKRRELAQGVLGVLETARGVDAHEDDVLHAHLAVLDLGDVFELGRQAGHAPQRVAILEIPLLIARVGRGLVGLQRLRGADAARRTARALAGEDARDGVVVARRDDALVVGAGSIGHVVPFMTGISPSVYRWPGMSGAASGKLARHGATLFQCGALESGASPHDPCHS